jgi:hypothetical protein
MQYEEVAKIIDNSMRTFFEENKNSLTRTVIKKSEELDYIYWRNNVLKHVGYMDIPTIPIPVPEKETDA